MKPGIDGDEQRCATCLLLVGLLFIAACTTSPEEPVKAAASGLSNYFDAKREYATQLEKALLAKETGKYRLVAVIGPAYPIGAILDPDNPVDVLTRNCQLADAELPKAEQWGSVPGWTSKRAIDLGAGLPASVSRAILSANLKINPSSSAAYSISDITQQLVPRAQFLRSLDKESCQADIASLDVIAVRGVIYGVETLSASMQSGLEADLKTKFVDNFSLKYSDTGAFELKDTKATPKFLVITQVTPPTRGGTLEDSITSPSDATLSKIESMLQRR